MIKSDKYTSVPYLLILFIFALLISWPFFKSGTLLTDDGHWAVIRLAEMVREFKDLQIPPRWSGYLNHGYGYPLFNFVYPAPYYYGSLLVMLGFSYIGAIKFLFILSIFASVLFMFVFVKKIMNRKSAFLASLFYLASPYRLTDLYIRGSLGESLSFILFPLIFYLTWVLYEKFSRLNALLLSLVLASLVLTHNVMALLFFPVWMVLAVFLVNLAPPNKSRKLAAGYLKVFLISMGLSLFFFLPVLAEKKYIFLSQFPLSMRQNYFLSVTDLVNSVRSVPGKGDFSFGIPWIVLILFSVIILFANFLISKILKKFFILVLVNLLLFLFLTSKLSFFFWNLPPLNSIDFPWRLLGPAVFFASIFICVISRNNKLYLFSLLLAGLYLYQSFRSIDPKFIPPLDDYFYLTNDATTTSKDELMPLWVKDKPRNRNPQKLSLFSSQTHIDNLIYNSRMIEFNLISSVSGSLQINSIYYPGWQFKQNERLIQVNYDNPKGLMTLNFPPGEYKITGRFNETPLRLISDLISFATLIYVVIAFMGFKIPGFKLSDD